MKQEDFDLSIENNVITLRGERKFEKTDETITTIESSARMAPSHVLSLCRKQFPRGSNAEYNNGVLRVTLPKREETKARRIQVTGQEAGAAEDNRNDSRNRKSERSHWRALKL
jgi:HSP20 family protein